ncbi:MAG: hypothetical protein SGPRY_001414 [Prymnesium sp.]
MLLSLRPRPLLIFLSMHEWCQRLKSSPRTLFAPGERLRGGFVYPDTPWARAEAETRRVCERYGQVCLSAHAALEPLVREGRPGFSLADVVGEDCLHPTHGTRGVEYISQILNHAFDTARLAWRASATSPAHPLPEPIHQSNAEKEHTSSRCYGFVRAADYRNPFGQSSMYRALQPISWESAACSQVGAWSIPALAAHSSFHLEDAPALPLGGRGRRRGLARRGAASSDAAMWSRGVAGNAQCQAHPEMLTCPRGGVGRTSASLRKFLASPPRTWFWCYYSLALDPAHQKKSPGVVALVSGATLHARLDTRMNHWGSRDQVGAVVSRDFVVSRACITTKPHVHRQHLSAVIAGSALALLLNLEQLYLVQLARASARPHAHDHPIAPMPARFDSSCVEGCATWFPAPHVSSRNESSSRPVRVARVSNSRQDAALFLQLGLDLQTLCAPVLAGNPPEPRKSKRGSSTVLNSADLLLLAWTTTGRDQRHCEDGGVTASDSSSNGSGGSYLLDADVLWGSWTAHMQYFDRRLRDGQVINSMMGLEHDTLGTPLALARSYQRCLKRWGRSVCNYSTVMHSHHDVAKLESTFGEDNLNDLSTWQDISSEAAGSVWIGYADFSQKTLLAATDVLPPGVWVVMPWPTQPLLWRHHRFILRTWALMPSVAPLRIYLLQDSWAHIVAKPYRSDQLMVNYKDRCVHLWSVSGCDVTHAHRVIRSNHGAFLEGIVGFPAGVDHVARWRRRVWPAIEAASVGALASVWIDLYRRVAQLALDWVIDEGGKPVLLDVDVDGVGPSDALPLSTQYATDALELFGVLGYHRAKYQKEFFSVVSQFLMQDLVDESHHAGSFARVFPQSYANGCAPYCHFFSQVASAI